MRRSSRQAWEAEHPGLPQVTPTGVVHVFNLISYRDVRSMLTGTLIAIVLISGLIMLTLRSLRVGLISLIPNLIPAAMAFGSVGLLGRGGDARDRGRDRRDTWDRGRRHRAFPVQVSTGPRVQKESRPRTPCATPSGRSAWRF